jgi:uncharacterized protein
VETTSLKSVALCLTHACNLRCRYCYAGAKAGRSMTANTAVETLNFLAKQSEGPCAITFFGGEPLLQLELIKEVVARGKSEFPGKFAFRMATNGTLLTPDVMTFLKANDVYFSLSLDGSPEQQNFNRVDVLGKGSYERVAAGIDGALAFNPYTVAVSVVTPETVEFLAGGVKHLFGLGFRYVVQTLNYSADWQSDDIKRLKRQYENLADFYYDSLKAGKKIYYSPFDSRIQTRAQKPIERGELCDLASSQIAIAASGRLYPCVQFVAEDDETAQANAIGDVWSGFDQVRRSWFVEQNRQETESCVGCALHGRCATYCGCVNWQTTGKLYQIPPLICEHERMLMPIVDRLANKLWKGKVELFKRKFYDKTYAVSSYIEDCLIRKAD